MRHSAAAPDVYHLAVSLLRILLPTVLLFSVSDVVIGVLYSYERFTMPAVVSIVIIAFIALFSGHDSLGYLRPRLGHAGRHRRRSHAARSVPAAS